MSETDQINDRTDVTDDAGELFEVYDHQRHRNGDETLVVLGTLANGYQGLAVEVDAGGQVLETEEIGDSDDREKAVGMLEYWLDQNPKGILGGEPADGGGGFLDSVFGGGDDS